MKKQNMGVFPNAPGCHLHQWLLWGMRNMLGWHLGPLLTSRPRDILSGSVEIVEFAGVGKGKGLGTGSSYVSCRLSWLLGFLCPLVAKYKNYMA